MSDAANLDLKPTKTEVGEITATGTSIRIDRIALRKLSYTELPFATVKPIGPERRFEVSTGLGGRFAISPSGLEVYLEALIRPDSDYMPIEIVAGMSGFFSRDSGVTDEELMEFAKANGHRMIFPYIREIVSALSQRGLFGPLWLDPLVLTVSNVKAQVEAVGTEENGAAAAAKELYLPITEWLDNFTDLPPEKVTEIAVGGDDATLIHVSYQTAEGEDLLAIKATTLDGFPILRTARFAGKPEDILTRLRSWGVAPTPYAARVAEEVTPPIADKADTEFTQGAPTSE